LRLCRCERDRSLRLPTRAKLVLVVILSVA